jgi:hypothetical protein
MYLYRGDGNDSVAYWRKANAIHRWFVENVQNGIDECQRSRVTRDQLRSLVASCKEVLNVVETVEGRVHNGTMWQDGIRSEIYEPGRVITNPEMARRLLPTQGGFFFGSTDYDQFYLDDLRSTVEQIEPLLVDGNDDFYYRSSW